MAETRYAKSHEWCRLEGNVATVGISVHAAKELNDLTFLDVKVKKGDRAKQGQVVAEIESVKATSAIYAPVSGTVVEVNARFKDEDELGAITKAAETEGWMFKLELANRAEWDALMTKDAYAAFAATEGGHH